MAATERASYSGPIARSAMAYVLAGGRGTRLMELTDNRAKPAVYFGGKTRIIDFALSNALNSGIRRIAVATQYKAHSLIRHLQRGWNFLQPMRNESFDILPASQRVAENQWYMGTADAVYQNIDIIDGYAPEYLIVLAGDHVYKMDYELMLIQHVNEDADVTVGCMEVAVDDARSLGVMQVDGQDRIVAFAEKPEHPPELDDRVPAGEPTDRRHRECDDQETDRPVARRVCDVFDRIRGEVALERVEHERRGGDERRGKDDSLEKDDSLQKFRFKSIPEYSDAT